MLTTVSTAPHRQPIKGNRIGLELPRHRPLQAASFLIGQR